MGWHGSSWKAGLVGRPLAVVPLQTAPRLLPDTAPMESGASWGLQRREDETSEPEGCSVPREGGFEVP